jgi:hypothetical protein
LQRHVRPDGGARDAGRMRHLGIPVSSEKARYFVPPSYIGDYPLPGSRHQEHGRCAGWLHHRAIARQPASSICQDTTFDRIATKAIGVGCDLGGSVENTTE